MSDPRLVNIRDLGRIGTWPADVRRIDRRSPYGNPFVIGRDGDRDEVCDKFERDVLPTLDVTALRGKNLICFCAPKRCHCDALLVKANAK